MQRRLDTLNTCAGSSDSSYIRYLLADCHHADKAVIRHTFAPYRGIDNHLNVIILDEITDIGSSFAEFFDQSIFDTVFSQELTCSFSCNDIEIELFQSLYYRPAAAGGRVRCTVTRTVPVVGSL